MSTPGIIAAGVTLALSLPDAATETTSWPLLQRQRSLLEEFAESERAAFANTHFSPEGRRAELQKANTRAAGKLAAIESAVRELRTTVDREGAKLVAPEGERSASEQTRAVEIRGFFRELSREDRLGVVRQAIASRDLETLRAVYDAPVSFGLLDARTREEIGPQLMREADPKRYEAWRLEGQVLAVVEQGIEIVRTRIGVSLAMSDREWSAASEEWRMRERVTRVGPTA